MDDAHNIRFTLTSSGVREFVARVAALPKAADKQAQRAQRALSRDLARALLDAPTRL